MEESCSEPWQACHNREVRGSGWLAYGDSQTGLNHAHNEDSYILLPLGSDRLLVAVADGLGGHKSGEIASRLACETLYRRARGGALDGAAHAGHGLAQALAAIVLDAHHTIANRAQASAVCEGMGCTLTVALLSPDKAWFCHVGDSRLYAMANHTCRQLTDDHRVIHRPARNNQLEVEETREGSSHLLEQALGIDEEYNPLRMQQGFISLRDGDSLLLCSDGLSDRVSDLRLTEIVCGEGSSVKRVHDLIEAALQAGSSDDITAVLVKMVTASRND